MSKTKIILDDKNMPKQWYNIAADMPVTAAPPLHPLTKKPITPDELEPLFPMALILQEVSQERYIDIPDEVLKILQLWRPSPLMRATRLEEELKTPAKIYYKYEGVSPAGSHKPNTAVAQAYYSKQAGVKRIVTETGAGQWGSAIAFSCAMFGIDSKVYMVRISYNQKPYRKALIESYGSKIIASPSPHTKSGRSILDQDADSPGSLGIAISEAVEEAVSDKETKYALGSVLNHVLLHQTVIGQEAVKQLEITGDYPDVVIGCVGGGSNFAGLAFPFIKDKISGKDIDFIAVEPASCPTLTKGMYEYDFGDTAKFTPLMLMYTLGHNFIPPAIHAGGLRYHGSSPQLSQLLKEGLIRAEAYTQNDVFSSAIQFIRTEGLVPAPESSHAVHSAIQQAIQAREEGKEKTILFNLSGHGYFDMAAYTNYLQGNLVDHKLSNEEVKVSLDSLK